MSDPKVDPNGNGIMKYVYGNGRTDPVEEVRTVKMIKLADLDTSVKSIGHKDAVSSADFEHFGFQDSNPCDADETPYDKN